MATSKKKPTQTLVPKDRLLGKISVFFFDRPIITAALWILLTLFGALSYGTLMKREGFPTINIPLALVNGVYFVNDPARVDADVAVPIVEVAKEQEGVRSVESTSAANFFTVAIMYEEGVDAASAAEALEQTVRADGVVPENANAQFNVPYFGATGGDVEKIDIALSFFAEEEAATAELTAKAEEAAAWLSAKDLPEVAEVFVKNPFERTFDPVSQQAVTVQRSFDRFGLREDNETVYHPSVLIGISAVDNPDIIKLDEGVAAVLDELRADEAFAGYNAEISASFAPSIQGQISELQKALLEGLLAVLVVGTIVIAFRASLITVISMVTVVAMTLGFLHLVGYTLNVITLFSLILALALIVDDTIIMVEAIDAARHRHRDRRKAVQEAARKVSRAMVAATFTAALSFAPLLFVTGILGSFIRAIPVTVISALIISLIVALVFIPFLARYLLLGKKQMGKKEVQTAASGFEAKLAAFVTRPMIWARHSDKKLIFVGLTAVFIGLGFIAAGGLIARNVPFNIFPPTKDTNSISVRLNFEPGLTIEEAEARAAAADEIIADSLGKNFTQATYSGSGSEQAASQQIEIISYHDRSVRSPELAESLEQDLQAAGFAAAVSQIDIGPPVSDFVVQVQADNRQAAFRLAEDLSVFMENTVLTRANGTEARFENVTVASPNQFIRDDGQLIVTVTAGFDGDDISALVLLAEAAVIGEFDNERVSSYGLPDDALSINIGQEADNQESFAALALAFPILIAVMYVLLAIQFKSMLQPLLIFMAIPFSIFGIALGLNLTDNVFSFFAMLGFFALLGLSVKNTILLTDYANQARRAGVGVVDSAVEALRERFRPLFATSATAVVSLIPLAITSPFWEGLMVVLIFGLISSTLLVVTVFPYYYLGAEYLRQKINPLYFYTGLVVIAAAMVTVWWLTSPIWSLLVPVAALLTIPFQRFYVRRLG